MQGRNMIPFVLAQRLRWKASERVRKRLQTMAQEASWKSLFLWAPTRKTYRMYIVYFAAIEARKKWIEYVAGEKW